MNMNVYVRKDTPYLDFIQINRGDMVVIKPNLVKESKVTDKKEWRCVITSAFVISKVCEYVCSKLLDSGKVVICDAPQTDSSFQKISEKLGLQDIANRCASRYGTIVEVVDLRNEEWTKVENITAHRTKLAGDPEGQVLFNLGKSSLFYKHKGEGNYFGADYDYEELNKHHTGETQEYLLAATPIKADVVISLPKMKTHKKTGVTLSIKNFVGITADKNYLPHHTWGSPKQGGDDYPDASFKRRIETWGSKLVKKWIVKIPFLGVKIAQLARHEGEKLFGSTLNTIRSGSWYGNDTTWRMTMDLNRCLIYGNPDGSFRSTRKRYYSVIDGGIAMEGSGPMEGDPKECGVYISGEDPASVDAVAATLMGFDWKKLAVIREAFSKGIMPISTVDPTTIKVVSDNGQWNCCLEELREKKHFDFLPPFGWRDHIELPNYRK